MLRNSVLIFLLVATTSCWAQFGGQLLIDDFAQSPKMVRTGDMDGDDDLDVLVPLFDEVVWYENLDGLGGFGSQNVIESGLGSAFSAELADIDGDEDLDVLITSFDNDEVIWVENIDGLGTFGSAQVISNIVLGAVHSIAADIDGDSDLDVVVNSDQDNILSWFENLDGIGSFGPRQVVTSSATNGRSVFAGDIDGDLDLDLVTSSSGSITLAWFENLDGLGSFGTEMIIAGSASAVEDIYVADLDGDNDLDVLSATPAQDRIAWHENMDGLGNFGPQQVISTSAGFPRSVFAADLDNDNDMDVLSIGSDFDDGVLAWYENQDGAGNFGPPRIIEDETDGSRSVFAADIDGDMDMDVLAGLLVADRVVWYQNSTIAGTADFDFNEVSVYPNPVKDLLHIDATGMVMEHIKVHDVTGRLLLEVTNPKDRINVTAFPAGILLVEITTHMGSGVVKIVKE